jgi:DNA-binding transcriptional regulator YhcF (GntR family)
MKQITIQRGWSNLEEENILLTIVKNDELNHQKEAKVLMKLMDELSSGTVDMFVLDYLRDTYNSIPKSTILAIQEALAGRDLEADTLINEL